MRTEKRLTSVYLALALGATVTLGQSPARADTIYDICAIDPAACGSPTPFTPQAGTTVPEPSTWAMLLIGFAALGYAAIRKARTKTENAP